MACRWLLPLVLFSAPMLALSEVASPVSKVVKLLEEMATQVQAEAKEDEAVYGKMHCWCETNDREKTAAIIAAEKKIEELSAVVEEGTAAAGLLTQDLESLKAAIEEGQDTLQKATALRDEERGEYEAEAQETNETLDALTQAVEVLSKVQLIQGQHASAAAAAAASTPGPSDAEASLAQVRRLVARVLPMGGVSRASTAAGPYRSVMQKDLWDLLGALPGATPEQRGPVTGLVEQPTGAAAGASSYNSRSGSILGLLKQMQDTFKKDLAKATEEEQVAEAAFQRLKSAKEIEVQAAIASTDEKTAQLADANQRVAQAKAATEDTKAALSADDKLLMDLKERCATADQDYSVRKKTRLDEAAAIAEAIHILSEDDARDVFSKSLALLQVGTGTLRGSSGNWRRNVQMASSTGHASQAQTAKLRQQRQKAASALVAAAQQRSRSRDAAGSLQLASLAVSAQLDEFTKVKKLMDKMVVELKNQQKAEYEKHEACKKDIDVNEDQARVKESEKKDLEAQISGHEGKLSTLDKELEDLHAEAEATKVALKSASEQRQAENHEFQQTVADARATVAVLKKALDRLNTFYASELQETKVVPASAKKASFLLLRSKIAGRQAPPAAGKEYARNKGAAGVLQLLETIIQDAEKSDQEAVAAEASSQSAYELFVKDTNEVLAASERATAEATAVSSETKAAKLLADKDLQATSAALGDLDAQSKALHLGCDFLLLNFDVRQQARQEEIESIAEAKSILSGAASSE